jgi:hypothetical protein
MKTLLTSIIFTAIVSIFAYVCMSDSAKNAVWVSHVNPVGVVLGFVVAFQGVLQSKKYVGLLGLTQLSFWPLYGFFLGILTPPSAVLQILLTTLITIYLGTSLVFFGLALYNNRSSADKLHGTAVP